MAAISLFAAVLVAHAAASALPEFCSTYTDGVVLIEKTSTRAGAAALCAALNLDMLDVTLANFNATTTVADTCIGGGAKAWIGSWYGVDYGADACLALYTAPEANGGAIATVASCAEELPVLCMMHRTLQPIPAACIAGRYAAIPDFGFKHSQYPAACLAYGLQPARVAVVGSSDVFAAVEGCFGGPAAPWIESAPPSVYDAASIALWNGPALDPVMSFETNATVASYNYSVVCRSPTCSFYTNMYAVSLQDTPVAPTETQNVCHVEDTNLYMAPIFGPYSDAAAACELTGGSLAYLNATEVTLAQAQLMNPHCAATTFATEKVPGAWVAGFESPLPPFACSQYSPRGVYYQFDDFCDLANSTFPALCELIPEAQV